MKSCSFDKQLDVLMTAISNSMKHISCLYYFITVNIAKKKVCIGFKLEALNTHTGLTWTSHLATGSVRRAEHTNSAAGQTFYG